jgi:hypothetical protein
MRRYKGATGRLTCEGFGVMPERAEGAIPEFITLHCHEIDTGTMDSGTCFARPE